MNIVNISSMPEHDIKVSVILKLMSMPGEFVSGEAMSIGIGVTRTSVWKHVQELRNEGCRIEAVPRKGYRLLEEPDLLLPSILVRKLRTRTIGRQISYQDSAGSTQAVAAQLAGKGEPHGTLVLAEEQGKGRGRLGRTFFSPRGGLWFSLLLRPNFEPQKALVLPLLAGVAVGEAIQALGELPLMLKWPNDVLIDGKKVAGILGEMIAEVDALKYVILGIGINVNIPEFPPELDGIATSLSLRLGRRVSRSSLLCSVLERFEHHYDILLARGGGPVLEAWRALPNILGCQVAADTPEGTWQGKAVDIDDQGALLLDTGNEVKRVMAGDVRLEVGSGK